MRRTNFTEEDIIALARQKGLKEVCGYSIVCKNSQDLTQRNYNISISGIDSSMKKKTLFFELTEWEELTDGTNQTEG